MDMKIKFPGGVAVHAEYNGHVIRTDQPEAAGGGGTAPSPFDLFLASLGTCAGLYALRFCQERGIATSDLKVGLEFERDPDKKLVSRIRIEVALPKGFPEKYRPAIIRSIHQCAVKRHVLEPPAFDIALA
jgi:putative redox protein